MYELHFAYFSNCMNYGSLGCPLIHKKVTLEEILALRHVWITLRQQQPGLFEPQRGELEGAAEISECNSYMSQRLDSLRRDFFLFRRAGSMRPLTQKPASTCSKKLRHLTCVRRRSPDFTLIQKCSVDTLLP